MIKNNNNNGNENIKMYVYSKTSLVAENSSFNSSKSENFLYPQHPVRCIITGPSECGKNYFLTNLILNINNECDRICITHQSFIKISIKIEIKVLVIIYLLT